MNVSAIGIFDVNIIKEIVVRLHRKVRSRDGQLFKKSFLSQELVSYN